jgi:hypothetical protein
MAILSVKKQQKTRQSDDSLIDRIVVRAISKIHGR